MQKSSFLRILSRISSIFLIMSLILFLVPQPSDALTNGILATDLLGQYNEDSYINPVPEYTKDGTNNGANRFGFDGPSGILFDFVNHRYFVSDRDNNRVLVYDLNVDDTFPDRVPDHVLGQINFYSNTAANTQSGLNLPQGLALDVANNRLFVAEVGGNRVKVFDISDGIDDGENAIYVLGQADFTSFSSANTQAGMNQPQGLAYDATNNRLFVAEVNGNRVKVWDVASITNGENAINVLGQSLFTTNTTASTQSGMDGAFSVAYDATNKRLFVAERDDNRVKVFNVDPTVLIPDDSGTDGPNAINVLGQSDFTSSGAAATQSGMDSPRGLAYDSTNNRLFVAEKDDNRVKVFDVTSISDGENAINVLGQSDFTSSGSSSTQSGMDGPEGLAYNTTNNRLFVAEFDDNRVKVFNVDPAVLIADNSGTDGPNAVNLLGQYDQTSFIDPVPEYTKSGENDGPNIFGFDNPEYAVFDFTNHRYFVSDYSNSRVLVYNLNTDNTFPDRIPDNVLGQPNFYTKTANNTQAGLKFPRGLAYDAVNNRLFVAEYTGHRVKVWDVTSITNGENATNVLGQSDFTSSSSANTQSGMYNPYGLAYDSTNKRLFVAELLGNRVKVWDVTSISDGENAVNVLGQSDFTSNGAATTQSGMDSPTGLAYDSTNKRLFVADGSNRVIVFDVTSISDGENATNVLGQDDFTSNLGANTQSGMNSPQGLAYDSTNNRLFVAEVSGDRVKIWDVESISDGENAINVIGQADFTSSSGATTQAGMDGPKGLAYDSTNDKLFVSQVSNHRISIFSLSNTVTSISGPSGSYNTGASITLSIIFSSAVTVTGTPSLALETGDTDKSASYTSGSGSNQLIFTYNVGEGDTATDLDYKATTSLTLNGGTIIDTNNNNVAILTLATPGATNSLAFTSNIAIVPPAAAAAAAASPSPVIPPPTPPAEPIPPVETPPIEITDEDPPTVCGLGDLFNILTGELCSVTPEPEPEVEEVIEPEPEHEHEEEIPPEEPEEEIIPVEPEEEVLPEEEIIEPIQEEIPTETPLETPTIDIVPTETPPPTNTTSGGGGGPPPSVVNIPNIPIFIPIPTTIREILPFIATNVEVAREEVKEVLEIKEVNTIEKVVVSGGIVAGASFSVASSLFVTPISASELPLIPIRLWSLLMGALGLKKKTRRWGVVYDSITKQPIDPAYVTLLSLNGKEIANTITDINGRYGFLVGPGTYQIKARKTHYSFPTVKLANQSSDELYDNIYKGETFTTFTEGEVIIKNIPLDPQEFDWNEFEKNRKNIMSTYSRYNTLFAKVSRFVFALGFVIALVALVVIPEPYNIAIFTFYMLIFIFRKINFKTKKRGSIKERSTGYPLSFSIIRIYYQNLNQEIAHSVADRFGHFYSLVKNGTYRIEIQKKNIDGTYSNVYSKDSVTITNGVMNRDFVV